MRYMAIESTFENSNPYIHSANEYVVHCLEFFPSLLITILQPYGHLPRVQLQPHARVFKVRRGVRDRIGWLDG
jgi:hypothetical protein